MEHAIEIQFKGEGQAVFEKIIAIWPPIIRQRRKEKIIADSFPAYAGSQSKKSRQ